MGVPTKFFTFVDSQAPVGVLTAARLNGDFDPLYACLDPATGGLEDTNVKSGAKIVCTDRAHTVTGIWTFTTAPVLPAASVAESKLILNYATHSPANDPTAGEKAALPGTSGTPSVTNKYVTDADARNTDARTPTAHNHNLNDLTEKSYNSLTDKPITGYALSLTALTFDPADGTTYFFGNKAFAPDSAGGLKPVYIPRAGTIKVAYIHWYSGVPSNEDISMYIRLNNTSDTLIETIGDTEQAKVFNNVALSIAVAVGDYIEIKIVCPTWTTNPTVVGVGGVVYVE